MTALAEAIVAVAVDDTDLRSTLGSVRTFIRQQVNLLSAMLGSLGFGELVKTGAAFEDRMARTAATLEAGGVSGAKLENELNRLHEAAVRFGTSSLYSSREVAEAMQRFAQLGFDARQTIEALPAILNLAAAGELSMADATRIAGQTMRQSGASAADLTHIVDVLAVAAARSSLDVKTLGIGMSYVGNSANSLGYSIEDTAAAIALLSNAGMESSRAGTSLRTSLSHIVKSIAQNKFAMRDMGLVDAKGNMMDLATVVDALNARLAKLGNVSEVHFLQQAFELRGGEAMIALMKQGGDAIRTMRKEFANADGMAAKMTYTIQTSLQGAFTTLRATLSTTMTEISTRFKIIPTLASLARNLVASFNLLAPGVRDTVAAFIEVAGVFSVTALLMPQMIGMLKLVASAFALPGEVALRTVYAALAPVRLLGAAMRITGLIAADSFGRMTALAARFASTLLGGLNVSVRLLDAFSFWFLSFWRGLAFQTMMAILNPMLRVGFIVNELAVIFDNLFWRLARILGTSRRTLMGQIMSIMMGIEDAVSRVIGWLGTAMGVVVSVARVALGYLGSIVGAIGGLIFRVIGSVVSLILSALTGALSLLIGLLTTGVLAAVLVVGAAFTAAFNDPVLGKEMKATLKEIFQTLDQIVSAVVGLPQGVSAWNSLKRGVVDALAAVSFWLKDNQRQIVETGQVIYEWLVTAFKAVVETVQRWLALSRGYWEQLTAFLTRNQGEFQSWADTVYRIVNNVWENVKRIFTMLADFIAKTWGNVIDETGVSWDKVVQQITNALQFVERYTKDFETTWKIISLKMQLVWDEMIEAMKRKFTELKDFVGQQGGDMLQNVAKNHKTAAALGTFGAVVGGSIAGPGGAAVGGAAGALLGAQDMNPLPYLPYLFRLHAAQTAAQLAGQRLGAGGGAPPYPAGTMVDLRPQIEMARQIALLEQTLDNNRNGLDQSLRAFVAALRSQAGGKNLVRLAMGGIDDLFNKVRSFFSKVAGAKLENVGEGGLEGGKTAFVGLEELYKKIQEGISGVNPAADQKRAADAAEHGNEFLQGIKEGIDNLQKGINGVLPKGVVGVFG